MFQNTAIGCLHTYLVTTNQPINSRSFLTLFYHVRLPLFIFPGTGNCVVFSKGVVSLSFSLSLLSGRGRTRKAGHLSFSLLSPQLLLTVALSRLFIFPRRDLHRPFDDPQCSPYERKLLFSLQCPCLRSLHKTWLDNCAVDHCVVHHCVVDHCVVDHSAVDHWVVDDCAVRSLCYRSPCFSLLSCRSLCCGSLCSK